MLVSLWPVDDGASGLLVGAFYEAVLANGAPLPAALRRAKLNLMRESTVDTVVIGHERISYAHPYFWAPYVLIGGNRQDSD